MLKPKLVLRGGIRLILYGVLKVVWGGIIIEIIDSRLVILEKGLLEIFFKELPPSRRLARVLGLGGLVGGLVRVLAGGLFFLL